MPDSNTTLPTVTARESQMLKDIRDNEYTQGERCGGCWAFVVCEDRSGSSVFGSLVKKGLAESFQQEKGKDGRWITMTELGADVLDDLLMMEGEGPVLEAPVESSLEAREHDFAPVMVEEADADKVVLNESAPRDCELDALVAEADDEELSRSEENRKGIHGRGPQEWQAWKDAKVSSEAARVAPGVESDDEPSDILKAAEELQVAVIALDESIVVWDKASDRVRLAEAALKAATKAAKLEEYCADCDGSGMVEVQDCGPSSSSCSCDGFSGGCTSAERCPCSGVSCRIDEDTGEGGDDCPCYGCIGERLDAAREL